ncbi:MAG: DUF234 domain-containing protein [Solirubrobacteraceae bacterium]
MKGRRRAVSLILARAGGTRRPAFARTSPASSAPPARRCSPRGQLVLETEAEGGDLAALALRVVATGRTKHHEIRDAVRAEPGRVLDRLVQVRLLERVVPVTERDALTRRRRQRIADNFLAFWLQLVDPHRTAIERGLGDSLLPVLESELDDFMGERYEAAFCEHLVRLAARGEVNPTRRWRAPAPCPGAKGRRAARHRPRPVALLDLRARARHRRRRPARRHGRRHLRPERLTGTATRT